MELNQFIGIAPITSGTGAIHNPPAYEANQRTKALPELSAWFFALPTQKRLQTPIGQSLIENSRRLLDFADEINAAHDVFPKNWCRHAALILMKRALVNTEPIYQLSDDLRNQGG